ncbi:MAG: heavy-metal-associated domain-containing protein [Planctomycetota bacterium]
MKYPATLIAAALIIGCGQGPSTATKTAESTVVKVTPAEFNADGAPTVEIDVNMHCGACAANVCKALKEQPGIVDVKADAETDVATVAIDEASFDGEATLAALAEANFADAVIKAAESAEAAVEATDEATEEPAIETTDS